METIFKFVSFLCLATVINANACCPDGWVAYNNKCYRVFFDQYEWGTAENICVNQYDGHLASPSTDSEHNFVNTYVLGGHNFGVWVGGNDIAAEGTWRWSDGSEFKFTAWHSGEPDGGNAQDCILLNRHDNVWVDEYCYAKWRFVCERPGY